MSSQISSVAAAPGAGSIRFSYSRRVGPQSSQHPSPQTFLPQQQTSARILHTGGIVASSVSGNLPSLAPRMVLAASHGSSGVSAPVLPVQATTSANLLPNQTPQGAPITVTQHDLQRLQQSGAIQPVTPTTQATGIAPVLAVRNVAPSGTSPSGASQVGPGTAGQPAQAQTGTAAMEAAALMSLTSQTSPLSALQSAAQQQPYISRKRQELTLAPHPVSQQLSEGSIPPGRIITLHQATPPAGSTPQITLQTVAPHVTPANPSSALFTQQVQQLVQQQQQHQQQQQQQQPQQQAHQTPQQQQQRQGTGGTVVIQSSTVRPEASSSPMRKRARKQQLPTVATPVTTPMTVEEEEEQKRKSMYMMAVDRHQMAARINSASEPNQPSSGPPTTVATHSAGSNATSDPSVSSVRLGSRADLIGSVDAPNTSVGNAIPLSTSTSISGGGNRYRANSAQSSTSSSGRSTPRLVSSSSQHRKRHSPRGHSFSAKLSRKALAAVGGKPSKRNRLSKVSSNVSSNATATASTSDTESDVEASVGVGGK